MTRPNRTARLECDHCNTRRQGKAGEPLALLRDALAEVGWYSDGDLDLCPTCLAKETHQ